MPYGVARAEEIPGFLEGEVRRVNLGEYVIVEIPGGLEEGFPGSVVETEDEARRLASNEAGVIIEPGGADPAGEGGGP